MAVPSSETTVSTLTRASGLLKNAVRHILPKAVAYRLASMLASWRRLRFPKRIVEHSYCGTTLRVNVCDAMAEGWYDHDWVDVMTEINVLKGSKLRDGAKVFDIGAHQAVVALLLSKIVGDAGSVLAIEADPWNAEMAERNRLLNDVNNLIVLCSAAAEADSVPQHVAAAGLDRVFDWSQKNVRFRSLDSLAREYGIPDVVYVDVDGFEVAVLKGASSILSSPADWFVEIHVGSGLENEGGSWQEVMAFFPTERYRLLMASDDHNEFVAFDRSSELLHQRFYLLALSK